MKIDFKILGGLICILSFTIYYILVWNGIESGIYSLGIMPGISLIFFGIGIEEKNINKKRFIFYPISFFFMIVFLTYMLNICFDWFFETNKMNLAYIITFIVCIFYYFLTQ